MAEFIVQFLFFGCLEACFMEWYKKTLRGDGTSTKASKYEIWGVALAVALGFGLAFMHSNDLNMGWWALIPYVAGMYALEFTLSMTVVKKLMRKWSGV